jgi:hypothetical protein
MRAVLALLRRFARDRTGTILVESVMVLPLMAWAFVGTFTIFEAFRIETLNTRNSYTIGDALSRETNEVTPAYIEGLNDVFKEMTQSAFDTVLRVTVVEWDEETQDYNFKWSYSTAGKPALTPQTLSSIQPHIPSSADADTSIIVETWMQFSPLMENVIEPMEFAHINITRPRFAAQLPWNGG